MSEPTFRLWNPTCAQVEIVAGIGNDGTGSTQGDHFLASELRTLETLLSRNRGITALPTQRTSVSKGRSTW
jgi:hypothetical protein